MADEYLWDRTGAPEPEIKRLEKLLEIYRHSARPKRRPIRWPALLAIAASLVLAASAIFFATRRPLSDWRVEGKRLPVGQTLETGAGAPTKLEAEFIGQLQLEPNSRLQILESRGPAQQIALRRGTMHAVIWAPPTRFVVDTPSARTVDLGCAYTLSVRDDDSGFLTVQTGWVAFQSGLLESFIPAGAECRTRPHRGPGVPYFEDASEAFRNALSTFDATAGREGLDNVLANARRKDAISLWHLAIRTSGRDRESVVERFANLVPGIDAAGLKAADRAAIDRAWNLLELGPTDWWRTWKQNWHA